MNIAINILDGLLTFQKVIRVIQKRGMVVWLVPPLNADDFISSTKYSGSKLSGTT